MASVGFRWLDILEKEFDKAFVDLDLEIGELHYDEPELVYNVRQKLCTLNSCFAQLTHKAQTIFQNSAKIEAELIHMRAELVESKSKRELLEKELHNLLLHLHSTQLAQLPKNNVHNRQDANFKPDVNNIKKKIQEELRKSPTHIMKCGKDTEELTFNKSLLEMTQLKTENNQLQVENAALRNRILALNSEVYGAKLAAKYLDKELAGRIQQLQLLGREMRGDVRDKLWRQLESEILLQRHKTVVRECRRNSGLTMSHHHNNNQTTTDRINKQTIKPEMGTTTIQENYGDVRNVIVKRKPGQGLGISITGGREHGVPILISELEPNGPAAVSGQLYIGDAILSVNDRDLRQACHREAVDILKQQSEDCLLQVQYIADGEDSDNSLEDDGFNFRYKFFDSEVCDLNDSINLHHPARSLDIINTPTAPRTPESSQEESGKRSDDDFVINSPKRTENEVGIINCLIIDKPNEPRIIHEIVPETQQQILIPSDLTITTHTAQQQPEIIDNALFNNNNNTTSSDLIELDNYRSNNSLNSENLSSPMQTSTDIFIDSELTSNDSQSPKNLLTTIKNHNNDGDEEDKRITNFNFGIYEAFSGNNTKSDQSLLNTDNDDSNLTTTDEDDIINNKIRINRDYKTSKKQNRNNKKQQNTTKQINNNNKKQNGNNKKTKKYFGVKTLQSIFNKYDGYSDISSTASGDCGDELLLTNKEEINEEPTTNNKTRNEVEANESRLMETSEQFESNIHNILSEMFTKNFEIQQYQQQQTQQLTTQTSCSSGGGSGSITINKTIGNKKHFKMYGQQLRVGKALRLCPNDDVITTRSNLLMTENERKEKLLARYVYNANSIGGDGVGDPDFGTPV